MVQDESERSLRFYNYLTHRVLLTYKQEHVSSPFKHCHCDTFVRDACEHYEHAVVTTDSIQSVGI